MSDLDREMATLRAQGGDNAVAAYNEIRLELVDARKGSKRELVEKIAQLVHAYGALSTAAALSLLAAQQQELRRLMQESQSK